MSKRQQQQSVLSDLQLAELIEHNEDENLFEHLIEDFNDMLSDKQVLRNCIESFIDHLVDEFTLGIIFNMHRKHKTNAYCAELLESGEEEDTNNVDVFHQANVKKNKNCVCPNCDKAVSTTTFTGHLENCMGIGRLVRLGRNATRRAVNTKDKVENSSYSGIPSDDDDDVDWNSAGRKRNRKKGKNGGKKSRDRSTKKKVEQEPVEALNVDIEGEDDELTNLRDMLHLQDRRSNSSSPSDGASNSGSPRKRDKSKRKSDARDRVSPSTSITLD